MPRYAPRSTRAFSSKRGKGSRRCRAARGRGSLGPSPAQDERGAATAIEGFGHEQREVGHGAADGGVDSAVDYLGAQHTPRLQPSPGAAALIDAAQWVWRLREARAHDVYLR